MNKPNVLWFCAGVSLTAILSATHEAVHNVPAAVAFGLLCFGCGVVLMQFFSLRKQEEQSAKDFSKWVDEWLEMIKELGEERTACEYEKLKWEEERNTLESEKQTWEVEKEMAIRKEALHLLEKEAARRGGEQIERDMGSI
jgi:hypothetical protein